MTYRPLVEPLEQPVRVEASAGTGKTFAICATVLRLVAIDRVPLPRILVTTFTEAATAELRSRIREVLACARAALEGSDPSPEQPVADLLAAVQDRSGALEAVQAALDRFDEAAILTLHGFCGRMATEHALECRGPLEQVLAPDDALARTAGADAWRGMLAGDARLRERILAGAETFAGAFRDASALLRLGATPDLPPRTEAQVRAEAATAWRALLAGWPGVRGEIEDILRSPALNKNSFPRDKVDGWLSELDMLVTHPISTDEDVLGVIPDKLDFLSKLDNRAIVDATKKNQEVPQHAFFDVCAEAYSAALAFQRFPLYEAATRRVMLAESIAAEVPRRKLRDGLWTFGDMVKGLRAALEGPQGERLAQAIGGRYDAALIDECQDTDPDQLAIVDAAFLRRGARVVLIGDPKQSVYAFRDADVFAYASILQACPTGRTLDVNRRSAPALVEAVNVLFSANPRALCVPHIAFTPAVAEPGRAPALVVDGDPPEPMVWWIPDPLPGGKPMTAAPARRACADAAAAEAARLLSLSAAGRARLGGRRLEPRDIAILTRTRAEAVLVEAALAAVGIRAVLRSEGSVLVSPTADDLQLVLDALAAPSDAGRLRSALATRLLGVSAEDLAAMRGDDRLWEESAAGARGCADAMAHRGVLAGLHAIATVWDVHGRLAGASDGERRLADLLHLGELLAGRLGGGGCDPRAAARALRLLRANPEAQEAAPRRLESEENLVQVATVHASKGLEWPVVICPFAWSAGSGSRGAYTVHDPANGYEKLIGGLWADHPDEPRRAARHAEERFEEEIRLLYVALTRARERCYAAIVRTRAQLPPPPVWLLCGGAPAGSPVAAAVKLLDKGEAAIGAALDLISARAAGSIRRAPLPPRGAATAPAVPAPQRLPRPDEPRGPAPGAVFTSFSSIVASRAAGAVRDRGEIADGPDAAPPADPLLPDRYPGGAAAGEALHLLLERVAASPDLPLAETAAACLGRCGLDPGHAAALADLAAAALDTPITAEGLRIRDVPPDDRIAELEFMLPFRQLDPAALGVGDADRRRVLRTQERGGYLVGAIDLVFRVDGRYHFVDWKTTRLGPTAAAYRGERLGAAMRETGYDLQAVLYALALRRHLRSAIPDYDDRLHFGGGFFLFLRGMRSDADGLPGVHRVSFRPDELEAMDAHLRSEELEPA